MKLKTKNYGLKTKEGFTLIETLLVVVIAVLVFIPMYSFYASTIKFDTETRYEIIASNLAQEGIELCRNGRDTMILKGATNGGGFGNFDSYNDCTGDVGNVGSDFNSVFNRNCSVASVGSDTSGVKKVTCTVTWDSFASKGTLPRTVVAESILTDWGE